jgi:hypothetical protein
MHRIVIRIAKVLLGAALSVSGSACSKAAQGSAAADVSGEDVRRLPPDRKAGLADVVLLRADRGRTIGPDSAKVTLLVVSDYQCAGCRAWFEKTLPVIRQAYVDPGYVRLVWAHYPLREHPAAVRASSAALCASVQGRFWEASSALFAAQDRWGPSRDAGTLVDSIVAAVPGVDGFTLRNCTSTNRVVRQVRMDIEWIDGAHAGAPPLLVVGKRRIDGRVPLASLRASIDSALAGH